MFGVPVRCGPFRSGKYTYSRFALSLLAVEIILASFPGPKRRRKGLVSVDASAYYHKQFGMGYGIMGYDIHSNILAVTECSIW